MQRDAHDSPNRVLKIEVGLVVKSKLGSKSLHIYAFANSIRDILLSTESVTLMLSNLLLYVLYIYAIKTTANGSCLLPTLLYFYIRY